MIFEAESEVNRGHCTKGNFKDVSCGAAREHSGLPCLESRILSGPPPGRPSPRPAASNLYHATKAAERERDELAGMIGAAPAQTQQRDTLLWTAGIALLLSPFVARLLPFGLETQVAAYILQANRWEAGQTLMKAENSERWNHMVNDLDLCRPIRRR
jgi:hypothetical protein